MPNPARRAVAIVALAAAIVAGAVALDLAPVAAQSDEQAGRIVAQRLADGRTEFGWQPTGGARVLPTARHFPADALIPEGEQVGRWLNSSPVEVEGEAIGRINARLHADGRIEFAFTPTDRERILTDARYFPAAPRPNRWLRSTEITIGPLVRYVAIAAGWLHTCAIRDTGEVECWGGIDDTSQTNAPEGSFIAVSAGELHTCAIAETFETTASSASAAGELECWGWVNDPKNDAPAGSFTAIAATDSYTCAIRDTGAFECWGGTSFLGGGWPTHPGADTTPPAGSFSAISTSYAKTCAIRADTGAIECWTTGYFNDAGRVWREDAPTGSFTALATVHLSICAIRDTGAIACWGSSDHPVDNPPAGSFSAIAVGAGHGCAIRTSDGAIECWGSNTTPPPNTNWGQDVEYVYAGQAAPPTGRFSAVAAGLWHTCAIRESGAIACWGRNDEGQTDVPTS